MLSACKTIWFTNHSLLFETGLIQRRLARANHPTGRLRRSITEQALDSGGRGSIIKQHLEAGLTRKQTESKKSKTSTILGDAHVEECNVLESISSSTGIRNPKIWTTLRYQSPPSSLTSSTHTGIHFSKSHPMASESKRVIVVTGAARGLGVSRIEGCASFFV